MLGSFIGFVGGIICKIIRWIGENKVEFLVKIMQRKVGVNGVYSIKPWRRITIFTAFLRTFLIYFDASNLNTWISLC